jgi:hypothetical protein
MKIIRLLLLLLLVPMIASTQDSLNLTRPVLLYGLVSYDIPKALGFTIGMSAPFHSAARVKTGSAKALLLSSELGEFHYPFAYTSILFNAGLGMRYTRSPKHFSELSINQGFLRTIYDGSVYQLEQDGSIKERKLFGRNYLTTQFSYSLNYRMCQRNLNLWFIQFRPSAWLQYPYNSFLKLHFSLQAGFSYGLKNHAFS